MHRDEGTPRLSSKMGLKDEDLKHFVCEEEDEMCDVRKKNDLKDKLAKVLNFSDSENNSAVKVNVKYVSIS